MQFKKLTPVLIAALVLLVSGCGGAKTEAPKAGLAAEKSSTAPADKSGQQTSVTDPAKAYGNAQGGSPTPAVTVTPGSTSPAKGGASWCEAGLTWASPAGTGGSTGQAKIIGLVPFKDKTYCQAEYVLEANGTKVKYTYYFNESAKDMWMVMDMGNGQKQEIHLGN